MKPPRVIRVKKRADRPRSGQEITESVVVECYLTLNMSSMCNGTALWVSCVNVVIGMLYELDPFLSVPPIKIQVVQYEKLTAVTILGVCV